MGLRNRAVRRQHAERAQRQQAQRDHSHDHKHSHKRVQERRARAIYRADLTEWAMAAYDSHETEA